MYGLFMKRHNETLRVVLRSLLMVRRFVLILALFAFVGILPVQVPSAPISTQASIIAQASLPPLFDTDDAAHAHCPRDVVVWLNIPSGIYHYKGERWYGRTKHGAFACEREAIAAGDRASENGQ
jgi:hypothetical protein